MRGLQTAANESGIFTILAVDHGLSLKKSMGAGSGRAVSHDAVVAMKRNILHHLASHASGVLLDVVYGLETAVFQQNLPGHVGLLLAVEDGDYATPQRPARVLDGWGVAKIKRAGGTAVKCFFYYHPDHTELAQKQEQFVGELAAACRHYDLPLFAEPLSYGVQGVEKRRVVIETAQRISRLDIDVLKIEFPVDVQQERDEQAWTAACQELNEACAVPWALLSAGVDFDLFARQVKIACQAGASGYLVGRAVWKEAVTLTGEAQAAFLRETAVSRLQMLAEIGTKYGRSWRDVTSAATHSRPHDWYKQYEGSVNYEQHISETIRGKNAPKVDAPIWENAAGD